MWTEEEREVLRAALIAASAMIDGSHAFLTNYVKQYGSMPSKEMERDIERLERHQTAIEAGLHKLDTLPDAQGEWTPVEDGEYDMGNDTILYVFGNTDPEVCAHIEYDEETIMLDLGMTICQRRTAPDAPAQLKDKNWGAYKFWNNPLDSEYDTGE